MKNPEELFWPKVDVGDCWEWTASKSWDGYGRFRWKGQATGAHRVAWELLVGPIPEGLQSDHLCRNRACVNPDHLEMVTISENSRRSPLGGITAMHARKTECLRGHPFAGDNLYIRPGGGRRCKACDQITLQARRDRT